jgi:glutamate synthase (ferredoxin)
MMRVCHLDTCPVGVATQNPELRKKFEGDPAHVVNFMRFIAQEMREHMAKLGFRTVNEMVGRSDRLEVRRAVEHWKAKGLDYAAILYQPKVRRDVGRYCQIPQNHGLENALDNQVLSAAAPALNGGRKSKRQISVIPIVLLGRFLVVRLPEGLDRRVCRKTQSIFTLKGPLVRVLGHLSRPA